MVPLMAAIHSCVLHAVYTGTHNQFEVQLSDVHIPTILIAYIGGQQVCLETLQQLAVADPRMVAHANGFRVLFAATIDPANQVSLQRRQVRCVIQESDFSV